MISLLDFWLAKFNIADNYRPQTRTRTNVIFTCYQLALIKYQNGERSWVTKMWQVLSKIFIGYLVCYVLNPDWYIIMTWLFLKDYYRFSRYDSHTPWVMVHESYFDYYCKLGNNKFERFYKNLKKAIITS